MDELVDILDAQGNSKGISLMKSEAHRMGWFHPTVHVWFYTKNNQVLIQQRGKDKNTFPLLWDVSVAGHVGAGELIEISALREVQEEIGLEIRLIDLYKIGVFKSIQKHSKNLIDCEFHHTYICELKVPFNSLKKQETEVESLALIPINQFKKELFELNIQGKYVPHKKTYYQTIITALEKVLIKSQ
ncbi:NUDIX domain-containing protein [Maribacter sp. PR1]|uniref:NUDIX domain-containing protein n=1 Tax=Maribacter cobaltidurans TaxID=1178778 RepID=A0ABU7IVA3_9FLAO|nr:MULTISPECIES: NUDIX domain-containing protein [Maribacter]MDC6389538.1 NUDIX domain-containing protein [Maribacter sp. PR1]MEE1976927.1 NUDIX domain-containing protein [Maribacter cobaltidurans]